MKDDRSRQVKKGKVVLEKPDAFAEGTDVEVRRVKVRQGPAQKANRPGRKPGPVLWLIACET